ncbi:MAG: diguanylate cyclase [Actinomycetota bacterium]|jgi:EAL domain-containing protein (putative c-di-GMP-specific phosphodiesterase class I)
MMDLRWDRIEHWCRRGLLVASGTSDRSAAAVVVGGLAASWLASYVEGGAGRVPPHWFYLPIIFAAVRFGFRAALATSLAAGVLAGPFLPEFVARGTAQAGAGWQIRGAFFVMIGQVVALLVSKPAAARVEELRRLRMCEDIRRGLQRDEFHLAFQPVVDLSTGRVVGTEALLRWSPPAGPPIPPCEFIPVAEESDVIGPLGAWVLERAVAQGAAWMRTLPECSDFAMGVNISARQMVPGLVEQVDEALRREGLAPHRLVLEITETALIDDVDACVELLSSLKALGVVLAIDDFGTGHSSLSYVQQFPVDIIKIDRSFIADIETNPVCAAVAGGIVELAHRLGRRALAEGIETAGQLAMLQSMRCDLGQGFHLGRPAPADPRSEVPAVTYV